MDSTGNLNPHLSAGASAEAIAVEANGSVTGSLAGVNATVTGGVQVGIGAHANVSIGDGAIHCDVGAALGVGANVGFDINASGAIRAICDCAQALWDFFF